MSWGWIEKGDKESNRKRGDGGSVGGRKQGVWVHSVKTEEPLNLDLQITATCGNRRDVSNS